MVSLEEEDWEGLVAVDDPVGYVADVSVAEVLPCEEDVSEALVSVSAVDVPVP